MIVDCAVYRDGKREPGVLQLDAALDATQRDDDSFVWIGLHEPTPEEFAAVATEFELHPLAVEDALHAHQRPKLEAYDNNLFVVVKTARYDDAHERVEFAELQIFVGERFVVSVRHGEASALGDVRKHLEAQPAMLRSGPMSVLYAIADRVVDDYEPVIDGLDNDLIEVEAAVFSEERENPAERIYRLKRQVLDLYRNTQPLLEPLERLVHGKTLYHHSDLANYFRDVEDHLTREVSRIETMRDLLSDALQVNLAHVAVRQNEDMRTISGWAAMAAVPTMLAGVWGMNFRHMPELRWPVGYPLALALMALASFVLYRYLRKQGWI
jgi:magnesium transporter